jgi:hypothetical protein
MGKDLFIYCNAINFNGRLFGSFMIVILTVLVWLILLST